MPVTPSNRPVVDPNALPGPLAHQVRRLADADAGTRFEAVEELLSSGDPRVLDPVLPLANDADPFVRRLVLEGISEFRDRKVVDTLLVALADPEEIVRFTAHASLKSVTGQNLPFDPDASDSERSAMQRRWKKWWDENRDAALAAGFDDIPAPPTYFFSAAPNWNRWEEEQR